MTKTQFKTKAEALFHKANPGATITGWVYQPRMVKYPTGLKGMYGTFHATAEGYRAKIMIAEWDAKTGWGVR
jgi:hypothetical protein